MPIAERIQKGFSENSLSFIVKTGILVLGVLMTAIIISRFVYPFDSGFAEAFNWIPATHILEGKSPYAYALTPPYSMTPYGIVFYSLQAIGVKLFGFQLWWGKLLSVLAFTGCLWSLAGITKALTGNDRQAVLFSWLAGLATFPAQFTIGVVRSTDLIAAAFSLAAFRLVLTLSGDKKTKVRQILGLIVLMSAAFFTKHTAALGAVFITLRFLQLRKWRDAALFASVLAGVISGGIFLLDHTSSGGYLWQHFTHAKHLPHSFADSIYLFTVMLKTPAFFFFLSFLLFFVYRKREFFFRINRVHLMDFGRSPVTLLLFYFLLSLGWSFVSAGRVGANVNYYTETSLIAAVICGLIYADFRRSGALPAALAMIVLLTLGGMFQQARILRGEYIRWQALSYYREMFETVGKLVTPGSKCISVMPEMVVWNGCEFHFDDYGEYSDSWSDPALSNIFERQVRTGEYAVIVWGFDTLQSKFPNYKLVPMSQKIPDRYYPIYLYVPVTAK